MVDWSNSSPTARGAGLGELDLEKLARKQKSNKAPKIKSGTESEADTEAPNPWDEALNFDPNAKQETFAQRIKRKVKEKAKLRRMHMPQDPVQKGRCSAGTWAYSLLASAGVMFFFLGVTAEPMDVWEMCSAGFLFLQAMYTIIFLGGDPCLIEGFKNALTEFQTENLRLKDSNEALEGKLVQLESVTNGLQDVYNQMDGDVDKTTAMLIDMERYSNLHTATSVVLQFFTCDTQRTGKVQNFEADFFGPQFTRLWDLVGTDYSQEKFVEFVREKGLTLSNLSFILEALIADDKSGCIHELDRLIDDNEHLEEFGPSSAIVSPRVIGNPAEQNPFSPRPHQNLAAGRTDLDDDLEAVNPFAAEIRNERLHGAAPGRAEPVGAAGMDREAPGPRRGRRLAHEAQHAMISPFDGYNDKAQGSSPADGDPAQDQRAEDGTLEVAPTLSEKEAMDRQADAQTWCGCIKRQRGPVEPLVAFGCIKIFGFRHIFFILSAIVGLGFLGASFVIAELSNIVCSLVSTSLGVALAASSRLLYVLSSLRKQIKTLRRENDRLEVLNEELADKVVQLQRIHRGFEVLQTKCEGNVDKGQELIRKSNLNIISTAHAVVNYLFQHASKDMRKLESQQEIDMFCTELEEVFRSVPNFDGDRIRASLHSNGGLTVKDLPAFVRALTSVTKPPSGIVTTTSSSRFSTPKGNGAITL